ncbi:TPD1 protein homolog 1-like [Nicotiana sylvestris]
MRSINGERSLLVLVFLLVSFSVIQVNHALEPAGESSTNQERHVGEYRIGTASCSKDNITVNQGPSGTLPNGIPTYTVIVSNACVFESCSSISNIHLSCGWFSSARLINPAIFRRLGYNDCLVNDGRPLTSGQTITFQYANTFSYPLEVSSVTCN